jgi:acyl-CoA reductase-like NAD-dependent aldehyde dehydrogenase
MSTATPPRIPTSLLIAGEQRPAADGATFTVSDPSTGSSIAQVAKAGATDLDAALVAARKAFDSGEWSGVSATDRGRVLLRVASAIRSRREEFARLEVLNAGHTIGNARWEADAMADVFEYYAGAANKHLGSVVPTQDAGLGVVMRVPVGVCGLIVPWNFPMLIATWKLAPALACGNPVVLKPASLTPLTALLLGEVLVESGVPASCVSVIPGPGSTVGDALVGDRRVDKISFTGDSSTGAGILRRVADNMTRVSLELGGKSAAIVFADADLDTAVEAIPYSVFDNAGQDCCARSRLLVERSVYDDVVARVADRTTRLVVGDPADESTEIGPMISEGQRGTSLEYLEIGRAEGAEVVCGGSRERAGLVPDPGGGRRRGQHDAHRTRGDLRAGAHRHPLRRRGGRRAHRERQRVRAVGHAVDPGPRPGTAGEHRGAHRGDVGEHEPQRPLRAALRRFQAFRCGTRARPRGVGPLHRTEDRLLQRRLIAGTDTAPVGRAPPGFRSGGNRPTRRARPPARC